MVKNSEMQYVQADPYRSNYIMTYVERSTLKDETDFVQYGQNLEVEFESIALGEASPSRQINWPTKEEPKSVYKFTSFWIE